MKDLMSFQRSRRQSRLKELHYGISGVLKRNRLAIMRKPVFKRIQLEHNCLECIILIKCDHSCIYSFTAHRKFLFQPLLKEHYLGGFILNYLMTSSYEITFKISQFYYFLHESQHTCNHFHNILRSFNVLLNFPFTSS